MSIQKPIVSVLTTCYNRADYVGEVIESVLAQTFGDFEYIIVDDGSSDGSFDVIQEYANKDTRLRVYQNATNLGDYPNRNRAAEYSTARYLKYVDSDDLLYPHCIEVMTRCMVEFPDAAVGLCAAGWGERPYPFQLNGAETFRFNYDTRNLFGRSPGNAMISRKHFEQIMGFTGLAQVGDFELWLRLAKLFPVVVMPRDLMWYRIHADQVQNEDSVSAKSQMMMNVLQKELLAADCPLAPEEAQQILNKIKRQQFRGSIKGVARGAARRLLGKASG